MNEESREPTRTASRKRRPALRRHGASRHDRCGARSARSPGSRSSSPSSSCFSRGATRRRPAPSTRHSLRAMASCWPFATIAAAPAWIGCVGRSRRAGADGAHATISRSSRRGAASCCSASRALGALLIGFDLLRSRSDAMSCRSFMRDAYRPARNSNALVAFLHRGGIVAPITEEIVFRGFLFRGLSASFLGVGGYADRDIGRVGGMHVQYDVFMLAQIFLIGLCSAGSAGRAARRCSPSCCTC